MFEEQPCSRTPRIGEPTMRISHHVESSEQHQSFAHGAKITELEARERDADN